MYLDLTFFRESKLFFGVTFDQYRSELYFCEAAGVINND